MQKEETQEKMKSVKMLKEMKRMTTSGTGRGTMSWQRFWMALWECRGGLQCMAYRQALPGEPAVTGAPVTHVLCAVVCMQNCILWRSMSHAALFFVCWCC